MRNEISESFEKKLELELFLLDNLNILIEIQRGDFEPFKIIYDDWEVGLNNNTYYLKLYLYGEVIYYISKIEDILDLDTYFIIEGKDKFILKSI